MNEIAFGSLRIDAAAYGSQGSAVLGIRDSGKTYTATLLAERLHAAGIPFVALDPTGVWKFLRVPGKGPGPPVVVAGGTDGDLPLTVESAPRIVEAALANGVSLALDLSGMEMSKADWRRIVADVVSLLLHRNAPHGLRHVFLEEAAEFCPQLIRPDHARVYGEVEKMARIGGNARLGYTLVNQRAEQVNKAVLELCDNLFLHRQKGKNSLASLERWLDAADAKGAKDVVRSLSTLPTGECWAWLARSDEPLRVEVPEKDSFHPDRRSLRGDVEGGISAAMSADVSMFVESMKTALTLSASASKGTETVFGDAAWKMERDARDLAEATLHKEIASLKGKLKAAETVIAEAAAVLTRRDDREPESDAVESIEAIASGPSDEEKEAAHRYFHENPPIGTNQKTTVPRTRVPVESVYPKAGRASPEGLPKAQREILRSLAWWAALGHEEVSRAQLGAVAGYSFNGGGFQNALGALRTADLIRYPASGSIALTAGGKVKAPVPDMSAKLHERVRAILGASMQRRIFDAMTARPRREWTREELGTAIGASANGGGFQNTLGSMRTLHIIDYPSTGRVALRDWLR